MKRVIAFVCAFALTLTACSANNQNTQPEAIDLTTQTIESSTVAPTTSNEPSATIESTTSSTTPSKSTIQEFGESRSIVTYGDGNDFTCTITYPFVNIPSIDKEIETWSKDVYHDGIVEVDRMQREQESVDVSGSLAYSYNAYVVSPQFASVEEIGVLTTQDINNRKHYIKTFNMNITEQKLLSDDEILDQNQTDTVLSLLKESVTSSYPAVDTANMDSSWLKYILLRANGVEIILNSGEQLSSDIDTINVLIPFDKLGSACLLTEKLQSSVTSATITPQTEVIVTPDDVATSPTATTNLDTSKPMVALTFDDGPSKTTPMILDLLDQYGGHATFFVVGNRVEQYASTAQQIVDQGSEIASHTWDHKDLTNLSASEIAEEMTSTINEVEAKTGVRMTLLRPPYGAANDSVKAVAKENNIALVNWSVDTLDWKTRDAQATHDAIMEQVRDGSIILMHDLHAATGEAMKTVIPELVKKGYQLVTVSELLEAKKGGVEPGTLYRDGYPSNNE